MERAEWQNIEPPAEIRNPANLTDWLYANCYLHRFGAPIVEFPKLDLVAALSRANQSRDTIDDGWEAVELLENGHLLARKRGIVRSLVPGEFVASARGPGTAPKEGDPVSVFTRRESSLTQPNMYYAFGETVSDVDEAAPLLRFYWNVHPDQAAVLVERITATFNRFVTPFRFKCPSNAEGYPRRDAGVLYVSKRFADLAIKLVVRVHSELQMQPDVPLFTRELAPGLGFAEDPGGGKSFGMHRCRLLAEALLDGQDLGEKFKQAGLSLERPWLNAGSSDIPEFTSRPSPGPRSTQGGFLDTAARIGARICRSAIWHEGACNWTADHARNDDEVYHAALGPGVYQGTAGVAWFLSRLGRATGDLLFTDTARGALRHAQSRPAPVNSLYLGGAGVDLVATEMEERESFHPLWSGPMEHDILLGNAGCVAALLALGRVGDAEPGGDWLLSHPTTTGDRQLLAGYSHGTAGIAWALTELYGATQQQRFADAARGFFQYERDLFHSGERNWPDLRKPGEVQYMSTWCHGAPGIVLSRLSAVRLLNEEHTELEAAIETTERDMWQDNWCLCHGTCGNADILLSAGRRANAIEAAEAGIERFEKRGICWPCGDGMHEPPGLMIGTAGVGHFYLRVHDEVATPSVLAITALQGR